MGLRLPCSLPAPMWKHKADVPLSWEHRRRACMLRIHYLGNENDTKRSISLHAKRSIVQFAEETTKRRARNPTHETTTKKGAERVCLPAPQGGGTPLRNVSSGQRRNASRRRRGSRTLGTARPSPRAGRSSSPPPPFIFIEVMNTRTSAVCTFFRVRTHCCEIVRRLGIDRFVHEVLTSVPRHGMMCSMP